MKRCAAVVIAVTVVFGLMSTTVAHAAAPPPSPRGSAAVSNSPATYGTFQGENGGALASCKVGGRTLLVVSGNLSGYTDPNGRATTGQTRVAITDAATGVLYWRANNLDSYVQTVHCRPRSATTADVYVGGNFKRFLGQPRDRTAMVRVTASSGRFNVALTRWEVKAMGGQVWQIGPTGSRIGVAGGSMYKLVNASTGAETCSVSAQGAVRSFVYARGYIYVGGLFSRLGTGKASQPARNMGKVSPRGCVAKPFSAPFRANKPGTYSGSNPLSITYDKKRDAVITCNGGGVNELASLNPRSGARKWSRRLDGDGQVCRLVGENRVFVGWHISGGKTPDSRGCYKFGCGTHGGIFALKNGQQLKWLNLPSREFAGGGRNNDGRNNGISGATVTSGSLFVSGAITRLGSERVGQVVRLLRK